MNTKNVNLCFLRRGNNVLLAMKKRDFGKGKWNGVGGKLRAGESFEDATVRETKEEIGVEIQPQDLQLVAVLDFYFSGSKEQGPFRHHCPTYIATKWKGEPRETEEMQPQWFSISDLPFESMWSDDPLWLPRVIAGEKLHAEFWFDEKFATTKNQISPLRENTV
jgi:ADP-ribose pyrophosphatase YjhB (NUDIX family)